MEPGVLCVELIPPNEAWDRRGDYGISDLAYWLLKRGYGNAESLRCGDEAVIVACQFYRLAVP